jgi:molybdopterin synthase catalytic subunit
MCADGRRDHSHAGAGKRPVSFVERCGYGAAVRLRHLYFAAARDAAGLAEDDLEVPAGTTAAALPALLSSRHPGLAPLLPRLRLAVDGAFALPEAPLRDGAEVALIPPVAGGAGPVHRVSPAEPSVAEALASVQGPDTGGVVLFVGTVREESAGQAVASLEYEAYGPMAERLLAAIAAECGERWPGTRVSVLHRTGRLGVGEVAVVIAAAAPHRAEAFAACRHAIERLKEDVPIWKRERAPDGSGGWVDPTA